VKPLTLGELVGLADYAAIRDDYRKRVIAYKRARRVSVGEKVSLLFEDRETLRFQIQEMLWVERIAEAHKVQHELDVYNGLLPGPGELSATLFIEIPDLPSIRTELQRLLGIDECVALVLSQDDREQRVPACFDTSQLAEDRISAVHYLRFPLDAAAISLLRDPAARARLCIDHSHYQRETDLPAPLRRSLIADLERDPDPLLLPEPVHAPAQRPAEVLFATAGVRALRSAGPASGGHIVIEPVTPVASLFDASPELQLELLEAVTRAAAELVREHGGCRIQTDVGGGSDRLQWHLHAPPR
jgi:hypothetical protein